MNIIVFIGGCWAIQITIAISFAKYIRDAPKGIATNQPPGNYFIPAELKSGVRWTRNLPPPKQITRINNTTTEPIEKR